MLTARRELARATERAMAEETVRLDEQRLAARRAIIQERALRLGEIGTALSLLAARLKSQSPVGGQAEIEQRIGRLGAEQQALLAQEAVELSPVETQYTERLQAFRSKRAAADEEELSRLRASLERKARSSAGKPMQERRFSKPTLPTALAPAPIPIKAPQMLPPTNPPSDAASGQGLDRAIRQETAELATLLARRHGVRLVLNHSRRDGLPDITPRVARWLSDYWARAK